MSTASIPNHSGLFKEGEHSREGEKVSEGALMDNALLKQEQKWTTLVA